MKYGMDDDELMTVAEFERRMRAGDRELLANVRADSPLLTAEQRADARLRDARAAEAARNPAGKPKA